MTQNNLETLLIVSILWNCAFLGSYFKLYMALRKKKQEFDALEEAMQKAVNKWKATENRLFVCEHKVRRLSNNISTDQVVTNVDEQIKQSDEEIDQIY